MNITQAEALSVVSLDSMKAELRIPPAEASQDKLLSDQIFSAANFVLQSTGLALADLVPLRAAIIAAVRAQYNGRERIEPEAALYGWMAPYRTYKPVE